MKKLLLAILIFPTVAFAWVYNIVGTDYYVNGMPPGLSTTEKGLYLDRVNIGETDAAIIAGKAIWLDTKSARDKVREVRDTPVEPVPEPCGEGFTGWVPDCTPIVVAPPVDTTWTECAWEWTQCTIPEGKIATVRYGTVDPFFFYTENMQGVFDCNNALGGDPQEGVIKQCWYRVTGDIEPSPVPPTDTNPFPGTDPTPDPTPEPDPDFFTRHYEVPEGYKEINNLTDANCVQKLSLSCDAQWGASKLYPLTPMPNGECMHFRAFDNGVSAYEATKANGSCPQNETAQAKEACLDNVKLVCDPNWNGTALYKPDFPNLPQPNKCVRWKVVAVEREADGAIFTDLVTISTLQPNGSCVD
jgi:hypothetical protein